VKRKSENETNTDVIVLGENTNTNTFRLHAIIQNNKKEGTNGIYNLQGH
jgi:hypothetical protein